MNKSTPLIFRGGEKLLLMRSLVERRRECTTELEKQVAQLEKFIKEYKRGVRTFFKKVTYIERDDA